MTPRFLTQTFHGIQVPRNVRACRWLKRMRLTRATRNGFARLLDWAFGTSLLTADGSFCYTAQGTTRPVRFNGRNAQFHALYDECFKFGYEFETALLLMRLLRGSGPFYDIGANWGYFSLLAAAVPGYEGRIYAFEPNPAVHADLRTTIEQAGLLPRVEALQLGVGAQDGELRLVLEDRFKTGLGRLTDATEGVRVAVKALDHLELPPPRVIKIDAEGMEDAILSGAAQLLQRERPFVLFENVLDFATPAQALRPIETLERLGYHVFNPTLCFELHGHRVLTSYGDPVGDLLASDPEPGHVFVRVTSRTRFLHRPHVNLLACHPSRYSELPGPIET